jgi:PKD repeat protein
MLMPDQSLPWLFMRISPTGIAPYNEAPRVQVDPEFEGEVDVPTEVTATVSDPPGNDISYRWFWGDGSSTDWIAGTSGAASHVYSSDGYYTVYVAAKEETGDGFITWNETKVKVFDLSDNAPHAAAGYEDNPISYTPTNPDMGDVITFTSHFIDDEGDELYYTWNFGDTFTATGETAEHQYSASGMYTVIVSVTDNHFGSGARPVVVSTLVNVAVNTPPSIDVPDFPNVVRQQSTEFTITASDDDPLRFTWNWGDGDDPIVTTVPTASHTYAVQGTYTLTVFADDLTGLSGHNESDTGVVNVKRTNTAPVIDSYTVSMTSAATGEVITFSGTARDAEGDPLRFTFYFDDGTYAVFDSDATLPNTPVTFSVDKAYSSAGTFNTYLYVWDYNVNVSSPLRSISVVANDPPIVTALSDKTGTEGVSLSFSASAIDPDGDPLTYYWHFGDGTYASGQSVTHVYTVRGDYTFAVYVDDGSGHNETQSATAHITAVPVLTPLEDQLITEGVVWTFEASATDADGDTITYTWDFGDGSPLEVGQTVTHAYPITGVDAEYDFTVWADDGSLLAGHNVSSTATATVYAIGVNHPPTVGTLADVYGVVDVAVTFTVTASDPDGDPLTITWNLGDGTVLVSAPPVTHTYVSSGDYDVTVWVYDESGDPATNVSRTAVAYISEDAAPVADAGPDQEVDEDTTVTFDGSGSSDDVGIASYTWTIVELSVTLPDEVSPTYEFPEPDVYTVELVVTDTIGQTSAPDTMIVTVLDVTDPIADAGPDQTVDYGITVTFDGSLSSDNVGIVNYTWVVNDDGIIELYDVDPSHVFGSPGEYTVRLFVTDDAGNSAFDEVLITVVDSETPVADAGPDQTVDMGATVTFDGSGSSDNAGIAEYVWTFDYDGVPETRYGVGPVFTFEIPGVYVVTLTVTDLGGNVDADTVQITVLDTEDPVADADVDQTVMVGAVVTFDGSGSSDNVGVTSYTWTFDYDGAPETLTGVGPTFTFDIAGDYTVTLTVEDAAGNSAEDTVVITVEAPNEAPVADAGADLIVTVGATVTFDGSGSSDSDGTIANYTWTFTYDGVAEELYDESPTFDFDIVGTYTVTLNVTDDDGATDTDTMTVTVQAAVPTNEPPVADAGDDQTVTVGKEVTFVGSGSTDSDGTIANYTWTFTYDGTPVTLYGVSPKFTFEVAGTYTVTLTVTDDDGDTDTDTVKVTVEEDDKKSFLESYGLPLGLAIALIVAALVAFFVLKGRKGGKPEATELEGMSAGEPEPPQEQS